MNTNKHQKDILNQLAGGDLVGGLAMVKASKCLKRGTVYVHLSIMEDEGLISSRLIYPDNKNKFLLKRRAYKITEKGLQLKENRHE